MKATTIYESVVSVGIIKTNYMIALSFKAVLQVHSVDLIYHVPKDTGRYISRYHTISPRRMGSSCSDASPQAGALFTAFSLVLSALGRVAGAPGTHDSTVCGAGRGRASPQSFYAHNVASILSAVVSADALTVLNAASSMSY